MISRERFLTLCLAVVSALALFTQWQLAEANRELRAFREGLKLKASWAIERGQMLPLVESELKEPPGHEI